MRTTPMCCSVGLRPFCMVVTGFLVGSGGVNGIYEAAQQVGIGGRQDAMPQVKDVAGAIIGAAQDVVHAFFDARPGGEQQGGVEVALDAPVTADARPCVIEVY